MALSHYSGVHLDEGVGIESWTTNYIIFVNRTKDLTSYLQRKGSSSWFWMCTGMATAPAGFWWGRCPLAGVPVQACSHILARKRTWLGGVSGLLLLYELSCEKPRSSRRIASESMPLPWPRKFFPHHRCTSLSTSSVNLRTSSQSHFCKEHSAVTSCTWQQSCLSPSSPATLCSALETVESCSIVRFKLSTRLNKSNN